jgi:hypothetical protein
MIHKSLGDGHPHGQAQVLVKVERNGDNAGFFSNQTFIETLFTHADVKDRNIVVFSIIGAYREGKSFFLDYCLRYLYARVSLIVKFFLNFN